MPTCKQPRMTTGVPLRLALWAICLLLALAGAAAGEPMDGQGLTDAQALSEAVAAGRGKVVLVAFFASWCGPCRREMPELIAARRNIPEGDLLLLGVSVDTDQASLTRYLAEISPNFPILRADRGIMSSFKLAGLPGMLLYDPAGRLRMHQAGTISATDIGRLTSRQKGGTP